MEFVKFELVAANIMDIRKHMVMWLDCEISSAIFCCGFTVRVAWPLVWIDSLVVSWPFTEKKILRPGYIENKAFKSLTNY